MATKWIAILASLAIASAGSTTPTIIGNTKDARCIEARQMALAAFRSKNPSLLWPVVKPIRQNTKIVLTQASEDISGGAGIDAGAEFDTFGSGDRKPIIFWRSYNSREPHLAIVDTPFNWQGDWYAVYILPSSATAGDLLKKLAGQASGKMPNPLLGDNRWAVPLVLTDRKTKRDWIIDRGEPYETLGDWQVYQPDGLVMRPLCRVSFGIPKAGGLSLLPPAVARFAAAADEALGLGTNEGTVHSTATIRLEVEKDWANAALRPWALTGTPYNTRAEIDHGLDEWAKGNRKRLALRTRMKRSEIDATDQLSAYYASRFGKSAKAAHHLSHYAIDHVLRDYFAFSKSR